MEDNFLFHSAQPAHPEQSIPGGGPVNSTATIRFLDRKAIDTAKWNQCIRFANNGLIYAQSWYLDALCDNWSALVWGNYEAVMPLPWRSKWSIRYVYTPYFVPALGIFPGNIPAAICTAFIDLAAQKFRYANLDVDFSGIHLPAPWQGLERINQVIESPDTSYSRLARRKLATAAAANLEIVINCSPEAVIRAYQKHYAATHAEIPAESYDRLNAACHAAPPENVCTLAAHLPGAPFAAFYLLLTDQHNYYSLIGGSTETGKKAGAFYALTDAAIQRALRSGKTFRFEGSDLQGIAFFNQQFGPAIRNYTQLRLNRLPWPIRVFKK